MAAAKLKELVDAMEREKYDSQEWHNARFMLQSYLTGHAQDFIKLLEAAEIVLNGRFLHDKAPTKLFANEAAAAITRAAEGK